MSESDNKATDSGGNELKKTDKYSREVPQRTEGLPALWLNERLRTGVQAGDSKEGGMGQLVDKRGTAGSGKFHKTCGCKVRRMSVRLKGYKEEPKYPNLTELIPTIHFNTDALLWCNLVYKKQNMTQFAPRKI